MVNDGAKHIMSALVAQILKHTLARARVSMLIHYLRHPKSGVTAASDSVITTDDLISVIKLNVCKRIKSIQILSLANKLLL